MGDLYYLDFHIKGINKFDIGKFLFSIDILHETVVHQIRITNVVQ